MRLTCAWQGDLSNLTVAEGQKWLADMSERHLDALLNGGDSWDLLMGDDTAGEGGCSAAGTLLRR